MLDYKFMDISLLLALIYIFTFVVGRWLEKIRIPWIFSSLILGFVMSFWNVKLSETFEFLASLGMYFLLFIIGFEIEMKEMRNRGKFVIESSFFIILFECIFGAMLIHYLFNVSWPISLLVGFSFATVGEAVLVPILDEFNIINTPLGQAIIGIGVFDDLFEIISLIFASILVGVGASYTFSNITITMLSLILLFVLTFSFTEMERKGKRFRCKNIETLFLFSIFVLFLFIGIGDYADAGALGALLAGVSLRNFIPKERLKAIESEIKTICYGLFAPLFFVWVGTTTNLSYIFSYPLIVLLIVMVTGLSKIFASWVIGRKELGGKNAFLLGIGLCVRFSTSIVIAKYLFEKNIIGTELYSVLVASTAIFTLVVPILFARLIRNIYQEPR